jgi:hypothetical protein
MVAPPRLSPTTIGVDPELDAIWSWRSGEVGHDELEEARFGLKDRGRRPEGGECKLNQILLQELAYVPSSNNKAKTLQEGDEHINQ